MKKERKCKNANHSELLAPRFHPFQRPLHRREGRSHDLGADDVDGGAVVSRAQAWWGAIVIVTAFWAGVGWLVMKM